mmetsp:Transcript_2492/g.3658  ORF Transcript_2492/g.3658 Transcript_2492/m.3658 type:complete len:842 (-) Transcript_2492:236-2761(-)
MSYKSNDSEEEICPLCCEELDLSDKKFLPCSCGYRVCMWCWHHIKDTMNGLCPACRMPYSADPHAFEAVDRKEFIRNEKQKKKVGRKESNRNISNNMGSKSNSKEIAAKQELHPLRVIQRNLVYVVGLPPNAASEEIIRKPEYFGQFGKISKVVPNLNLGVPVGDIRHGSASAYITFCYKEDARACIHSVNGFILEGRAIKANFGTSKYCNNFLCNLACNNPDCMYLHEMGEEEDRFSKDEIQSLCLLAPSIKAGTPTATGSGGPSGTGKRCANPILPPPEWELEASVRQKSQATTQIQNENPKSPPPKKTSSGTSSKPHNAHRPNLESVRLSLGMKSLSSEPPNSSGNAIQLVPNNVNGKVWATPMHSTNRSSMLADQNIQIENSELSKSSEKKVLKEDIGGWPLLGEPTPAQAAQILLKKGSTKSTGPSSSTKGKGIKKKGNVVQSTNNEDTAVVNEKEVKPAPSAVISDVTSIKEILKKESPKETISKGKTLNSEQQNKVIPMLSSSSMFSSSLFSNPAFSASSPGTIERPPPGLPAPAQQRSMLVNSLNRKSPTPPDTLPPFTSPIRQANRPSIESKNAGQIQTFRESLFSSQYQKSNNRGNEISPPPGLAPNSSRVINSTSSAFENALFVDMGDLKGKSSSASEFGANPYNENGTGELAKLLGITLPPINSNSSLTSQIVPSTTQVAGHSRFSFAQHNEINQLAAKSQLTHPKADFYAYGNASNQKNHASQQFLANERSQQDRFQQDRIRTHDLASLSQSRSEPWKQDRSIQDNLDFLQKVLPNVSLSYGGSNAWGGASTDTRNSTGTSVGPFGNTMWSMSDTTTQTKRQNEYPPW